MKLNDYPTPRTLAFRKQHGGCWNFRETELLHEHAQLEREAAAWQDVAMMYRNPECPDDLDKADRAFDRLLAETNKTDEHSA